MKKELLAAVIALVAAQSSHALFGIGGSYGRNFTSVSSATDVLGGADLPSYLKSYGGAAPGTLTIARDGVDGLNQLGLKAWLDLPLLPIEFEAAANVAWGSYKSSVQYIDPVDPGRNLTVTTGIESAVPVPGIGSGETPYVSSILDASVRYPFLKLPPLSPLKPFKIYVGGGVSWFYASKVVSKDDVGDIFDVAGGAGQDAAAAQAALSKELKDNFYESTIGGHVLLGAQLKIPVLPIALFADGKWYFNAAPSSAASNYPLAISAGLGLAL